MMDLNIECVVGLSGGSTDMTATRLIYQRRNLLSLSQAGGRR